MEGWRGSGHAGQKQSKAIHPPPGAEPARIWMRPPWALGAGAWSPARNQPGPPAPRAACSAQASLWFVRPLVGHSARWVIRGSNQLPESRWPDPPVWIHFLLFSVRLPAADPPSRLGEQASLPPPVSVPHSGAWSWQARKRLPGPPCLCLRGTRQSFRRAENLLSDPGDSPRPGSQVGSFRVGRSEGLDTRPTVPRCLWPRDHAAPQPAWSRGWCGPIRRGRAARGRGPHTVLRCALRSVWSPRPGGPRQHQPPNSQIQRLHRWQHVCNPGFKDPIRGLSAWDPRSCRIPALPPCIRARCPGVRCRRPAAQRRGTARLPAWCAGGDVRWPVRPALRRHAGAQLSENRQGYIC